MISEIEIISLTIIIILCFFICLEMFSILDEQRNITDENAKTKQDLSNLINRNVMAIKIVCLHRVEECFNNYDNRSCEYYHQECENQTGDKNE